MFDGLAIEFETVAKRYVSYLYVQVNRGQRDHVRLLCALRKIEAILKERIRYMHDTKGRKGRGASR